jgi:hypothetical protein
MDEVKAGDKVVVKYVEKEGKMMATTVGKAPAKTAKALRRPRSNHQKDSMLVS